MLCSLFQNNLSMPKPAVDFVYDGWVQTTMSIEAVCAMADAGGPTTYVGNIAITIDGDVIQILASLTPRRRQ